MSTLGISDPTILEGVESSCDIYESGFGRVSTLASNDSTISEEVPIEYENKVAIHDACRVVGATYANGWLIIVGASKTSPVPGNGMRRRHARRRILPRFGALRGDNTPSPALRGLRVITRSTQVATSGSLSCSARGRRRARLALLLSLCGV